MKVYQLAKELGVSAKEIIAVIRDTGGGNVNHLNILTIEQMESIKERLGVPIVPAPEFSASGNEVKTKYLEDVESTGLTAASEIQKGQTKPLTIVEHLREAERMLVPILRVHSDNTSLTHGNMMFTTNVIPLIEQGIEQLKAKGFTAEGI